MGSPELAGTITRSCRDNQGLSSGAQFVRIGPFTMEILKDLCVDA
jgi:hypothetical protein